MGVTLYVDYSVQMHGIKKECEIKLFGFSAHTLWGNISALVICLFTFRGLQACVIGHIQRPHVGLNPSFVQTSHAASADDNIVCWKLCEI